jgi:hypothetical protein
MKIISKRQAMAIYRLPGRNGSVSFTGIGNARWVVMGDDYRSCIMTQCRFHNIIGDGEALSFAEHGWL